MINNNLPDDFEVSNNDEELDYNDDAQDEYAVDDMYFDDDMYSNDDDPVEEIDVPLSMQLDRLTGLKTVKEKLYLYEKVVKFNKMREDHHLNTDPLPLHAMFLGSPGTGKTTVALAMGRLLRSAGVLSSGHVVERQRASLLGPNYSMEETNTLEAIEAAQGGILFIDEAYQLYQPNDPRDPGRFVIETLMTALADETRRDWMLILAGYPDEMKRMFDMNPGLRSRIPETNIYTFDDYTEKELLEIAERYLIRNSYLLPLESRRALAKRITFDYKHRDKTFGNARYVINMIQTEILPAMAARVVGHDNVSERMLSEIEPCDIPAPKLNNIPQQRIGFY